MYIETFNRTSIKVKTFHTIECHIKLFEFTTPGTSHSDLCGFRPKTREHI